MPDFENDVRCIKLDKKIGYYADAVRDRQIDRAQYLKKFGHTFDVHNRFPYPYDDDAERRLINEIDSYLLSFPEGQRAEVNGHFLKEYRHYLSTPFAKHARELAMWAVRSHPLTDKDKLDFLDYLYASNKYEDFDKRTLYKLADYNPNDCLEATNRLYVRALSSLGKTKRKKDDDVAFIKGMLNVFAEKVDTVSPDMAVNYAKIYFRLADKTSKILTPWILGKLATKTPQAKASQYSGQKKSLDKETINLIFAAYVEHTTQSKEFNENLAEAMFMLAETAVENYEYTPPEAKKLIDIVRGGIPNNKRETDRNKGLEMLAGRLGYLPVNPLAGIDLRADTFRPTNAYILGYAGYLCHYAAYYPGKKVAVEDLRYLLEKHAHSRRLDIEEATLFAPARKKKAVDRALVLEIASIYGESLRETDAAYCDVNEDFRGNMAKMFKDIVADYNYNGYEARVLSNAVSSGSKGTPYSQKTGKDIFAAYTAAYKRRYRAAKSGGRDL